MLDRFFFSSQRVEHEAKVVVRICEFRVTVKRLLIKPRRLRRLLHVIEQYTEVKVGSRLVRGVLDRRPIVSFAVFQHASAPRLRVARG